MPSATKASERIACAVLAAQVVALRDRMDASEAVEVLFQTNDMLSGLSELLGALSQSGADKDSELDRKRAAAVTAMGEISGWLEKLALLQAQHHDLARQMADCVVTALGRLATNDGATGARLSPDDLAALYVSEEQRKVHEEVTRQFAMGGSGDSKRLVASSQQREGLSQ